MKRELVIRYTENPELIPGEYNQPGWYYWINDEPVGPFISHEEARENAKVDVLKGEKP